MINTKHQRDPFTIKSYWINFFIPFLKTHRKVIVVKEQVTPQQHCDTATKWVSRATRNRQLVSLKVHTASQQLQYTSHVWTVTREPSCWSWTGHAGLRPSGSQATAVVGCKADRCLPWDQCTVWTIPPAVGLFVITTLNNFQDVQ